MSNPVESIIQVYGLRREFGDKIAVRDVDFFIESGAVMGLIGPNGAGKTTLLKLISGLLEPTKGTAVVGGWSVVEHPRKVREKVGFFIGFLRIV